MLIVGLTGGVASGKSVVSQILKEEGAYLVDADQVARELVEPRRPTYNKLIKAFGKEILQKDGSIDRRKLAVKIFSDPKQRDLLNRILHPRIKKEMDRQVKAIGQKDPKAIVVIDAPLLIETGYHREMDKVIVVTTTKAQQMERLKKRAAMDQEVAKRVIASQVPTEEKVKVADFVIRNEGSLEETEGRTKQVFRMLKRLALDQKEC